MGKEIVDGQISIFDIISSEDREENHVPQIMLKEGDVVYKVLKGNVCQYTVTEEKSWIFGTDNRGYRLVDKDGIYNVTSNSKLGVDCFRLESDARQIAEQYLDTHDVICAKDIQHGDVIAYSYIRDLDGREMTAFYTDIGNGLLYMKEFMSYHYIVENTPKNIRHFMEQQEFSRPGVHKVNFTPSFKNMYRSKEPGDSWIYAEAGYSAAIG